jgi:polyphosphate kinase
VWGLLLEEMAAKNVSRVVSVSELGPEDRAFLHEKFRNDLWPQLTPQSIDNAHPFPFVPNKGMGLALTLTKKEAKAARAAPSAAPGAGSSGSSEKKRRKEARDLYSEEGRSRSGIEFARDAIPSEMRAILLLPQKISRFIRLPDQAEQSGPTHVVSNSSNTAGLAMMPAAEGSGGSSAARSSGARFVLVEDMLSTVELKSFFPEREIKEKGMFRVLRDSEVEVDEEAVDLVRMFETALKRRRKGAVVRLDVESTMPEGMRKWLSAKMGLADEDYLYVQKGLVGLGDVSQVISPSVAAASARGVGVGALVYPPFQERMPERVTRDSGGDIFAAIQRKDMVVHHPFESFQTVLTFLRQAARDPNVIAIKQTLYRTNEDSPIVQSLIEAAESGKTVTVLIELKARFDEEANIRWAKDLERAGVHVVYGFRELKTHAKVSLVVRRESSGLRIYVHLGTGNYHSATAKVYTDLSLFTADPVMGRDATRLFNFCSAYSTASLQELEVLAVAPFNLRSSLEELIEAEIGNARAGLPAHVLVKCNSLVDTGLIKLLYRASEAGVNVSAVVRGMCALRPGVPGLSSRIRVKSIVGRFLEHSRIVAFANGHAIPSPENKVFISSADWMTRNLVRGLGFWGRARPPLASPSRPATPPTHTPRLHAGLARGGAGAHPQPNSAPADSRRGAAAEHVRRGKLLGPAGGRRVPAQHYARGGGGAAAQCPQLLLDARVTERQGRRGAHPRQAAQAARERPLARLPAVGFVCLFPISCACTNERQQRRCSGTAQEEPEF